MPPWGNGDTRSTAIRLRPGFCYCSKFGFAVEMS